MKSFIICCIVMFIAVAAFPQKSRNIADTTITTYLKYSCFMHPQYVSNIPAKCPVCNSSMNLSKKEQIKMEVMRLYTCPMDHVICTGPGKCPECKMDMVELKPKDKSKKN